MKTIQELRQACAAAGIKLRIETRSHGKHAIFEIAGVSASSVASAEFCAAHREKFDALLAIKSEFHGNLTEKLYGLLDATLSRR
jgi:hypothetical protein